MVASPEPADPWEAEEFEPPAQPPAHYEPPPLPSGVAPPPVSLPLWESHTAQRGLDTELAERGAGVCACRWLVVGCLWLSVLGRDSGSPSHGRRQREFML